MNQREVGTWLSGPKRHPQRVEDEIGTHVRSELPADDAAGERVDHEAEEHGPFPAAQIGEVRDPQRIRSRHLEVAVDQIRAPQGARVGFGGPPRLPAPLSALKALAAHQPRNLVTTDALASAHQRTPHPSIPIRPKVVPVHLADPGPEPLFADRPGRPPTGGSLVIRGR